MKKQAVSLLVLGIIVTSLTQGGYVYAAEKGEGFFESLISKIAAIFGFNKGKVSTVVNEAKKSRSTEEPPLSPRPTGMEGTPPQRPSGSPSGVPGEGQTDKLAQAVKDGKITEAQKVAILAKLEEVRKANNPETMKKMTDAERKTAMEAQKTELEAWATSQGIDVQYVTMGMMGSGPGGRGGQGNGIPPQGSMDRGEGRQQ